MFVVRGDRLVGAGRIDLSVAATRRWRRASGYAHRGGRLGCATHDSVRVGRHLHIPASGRESLHEEVETRARALEEQQTRLAEVRAVLVPYRYEIREQLASN